RDMAAGARTLPIAYTLRQIGEGERASFLALLDLAKTDRGAQLKVRKKVRDTGGIVYASFRSQVHLERSRDAFLSLRLATPWSSLLERLPAARSLSDLRGGR